MIDNPTANLKPARTIVLISIIWLTAVAGVASCGKKGPPEPPRGNRPPRVRDLGYSTDQNSIKLTWTVPQTTAKAKNKAAGFLIFQSKQADDDPECPSCPVFFTQIGDVPAGTAGAGQAAASLVFSQGLEPGYRYIFKVKTYDDDGLVSRDSNFVDFLF